MSTITIQMIEFYQKHEKIWLAKMNFLYAPLKIEIKATASDLDEKMTFVTTITGKQTGTLNKVMSYREWNYRNEAILHLFNELDEDVKIFLTRFACDNF